MTAYNIDFKNNITQNGNPFNTSQWTTNSSPNYIYYNNNVSIGKNTNSYALDISGIVNIGPSATTNGIISGNLSVGPAGVYGINNSGDINGTSLTIKAPTSFNYAIISDIPNNGMTLQVENISCNKIIANNEIRVGGDALAKAVIYQNGNIKANEVTALSFNATSDHRIKINIEPLNGTHTVDELNPVSYYNVLSGKNDVGFIAREVQEIYPMLVNGQQNSDQYQSINYNGLIAVAIKEIKDLKTKVNNQEILINKLIRERENA